jgi:hypothetical protein
MSAIVAVLAAIVREVLAWIATRPSVTAEVQHGKTPLAATPLAKVIDRGRRSGLLLLVACAAIGGCGASHVVVATLHPVEDQTHGWPRVAQNSVTVLLDGTSTIGTVEPAAGYFLIHEADLKALLKAANATK